MVKQVDICYSFFSFSSYCSIDGKRLYTKLRYSDLLGRMYNIRISTMVADRVRRLTADARWPNSAEKEKWPEKNKKKIKKYMKRYSHCLFDPLHLNINMYILHILFPIHYLRYRQWELSNNQELCQLMKLLVISVIQVTFMFDLGVIF